MTKLSVCGCCEGLSPKTPVEIYNRPGLNDIVYRTGNFGQFKASLLTKISGSTGELSSLTTREDSDFTIALLDSWAIVSDILTFYQERIANENYLRTAKERLSVLEMARMIGYELSPGLAASTYLSFTLEDTPGALSPSLSKLQSFEEQDTIPPIKINPGIKVQSIPGQNEKPQVYETTETIDARPAWNAIPAKTKVPTKITEYTQVFFIEGIEGNIKTGDIVLLKVGSVNYARYVLKSEKFEKEDFTKVTIRPDTAVGPSSDGSTSVIEAKVSDFDGIQKLNDAVASQIFISKWKAEELELLLETKNWKEKDLIKSAEKYIKQQIEQNVTLIRNHAFVFGYNAPKIVTYTRNRLNDPSVWDEWSLNESTNKIFLDKNYEGIEPGSIILVQDRDVLIENALQFKIDKVESTTRNEYNISGPTSLLTLPTGSNWYPDCNSTSDDLSCIRNKIIHVGNEALSLTMETLDTDVSGSGIILDGLYFGLKPGKKIMVTGKRSDLTNVIENELAIIKHVYIEGAYTILELEQSLEHSYLRGSVLINANVAAATHGETVSEILGSGDATIPFQKFTLKQPPLTYVSSDQPGGIESTLEVRVNDILWNEVPYFTGHGPEDRIYTIRLDDQGRSTITFGDGITGARLPTGSENVKANYRKGLGSDGLLNAYRLNQLMSRPLGVKSAENQLPTSGAGDSEKLIDARKNAPLSVLTMDRVVTLQDYEDYSRSFAGIDKSLANWVWKDQKQWIHLTVAGTNGAMLCSDSTIKEDLLKSLRKYGNPRVPILINSYIPRFFKVDFSVEISPEFIPAKIKAEIDEKLHAEFSFENREFGQPVWKSEVITLIQEIDGVISVDVDALYFFENLPSPENVLRASLPQYKSDQFAGAELIMLDPQPVNTVFIS